jgi:TolA-binding protein
MSRSISITLAMALLLPVGVSAQAHQHGPQAGGGAMPSDSTQGATMQMHDMMQMHQQMQEHMAQMQEHMQAMQGMMQMHGQEGMSGMGQQQAMQGGTCVTSGVQAGLSALLLGGVTDLGLTEAQTSSLEAILDQARTEALQALTPEQRQKLEAAPSAPSVCPRAQPSTGPGG